MDNENTDISVSITRPIYATYDARISLKSGSFSAALDFHSCPTSNCQLHSIGNFVSILKHKKEIALQLLLAFRKCEISKSKITLVDIRKGYVPNLLNLIPKEMVLLSGDYISTNNSEMFLMLFSNKWLDELIGHDTDEYNPEEEEDDDDNW